MSMRGGDGAALCARECSPTEEAYSPSLTDAETVGDEDATDRERDSDEALKREMLQTFEKTRIDDLTKRVAELKGQLIETYQRAQVEKIRADRAEVRLSFAGIGEPLSTQQQMLHIQEERDNATALCDKFKKKLKEVKKEAEQIRGAYDFTLEANVKLTADLEEARNENVGDNETELSHVRTMVAARDAKIEKLVDKNESLTAQYFATSETLKKIKKDSRKDSEGNSFYKAQNENLKSDLEEAQAKLARALLENGRLQGDNVCLLSGRNGGYSNHEANSTQEAHATSENNKLKETIDTLNHRLNGLRLNMARHITELDLAKGGIRVFNCDHYHFRDVPDGRNSTRELCFNTIADELFQDWMNDTKFIKEYNNARRMLLAHHRAHEKVAEGRGVASWRMKKEFTTIDEKRGVQIKY